MMKVNFYATLRPIVGQKTIEVQSSGDLTAMGLIHKMIANYPDLRPELLDENGKFYDHMKMFVNGREVVYLEGGFDYRLQETDKIDIFPPVGGG